MSSICKYLSLFGTRFSKVYGIEEYGFGPSIPRIFVSRWAVPLHGCGARDHLWCKFQCNIYIFAPRTKWMDLGPILQFSYAFDPLRYRYVSINCYIYVRVSTSSMHRDQACMKCIQAKVSHIHNVKTILIVYMFSMSITHQ